jgi:hypothetical protein
MSFDPTSSVSAQNTLSYLNQDNEAKPIVIRAKRSPTSFDRRYRIGTFWVNFLRDESYQLTSNRGGATWIFLGGGVPVGVDSIQGNTGGALTGNISLLGGDTTIVNGTGSTLTIDARPAGYPITPYVVGQSGEAGYATIQAAIAAANAAGGGDIYVQPGTYSENLTFFDEINIIGSSLSGVEIIGTHIPPVSGEIQFHNCTLSSATDIFNSSAAGTTQITITYCLTKCTNGYLFNLPNWTGVLNVSQTGSTGTADGFINNTGGATVIVHSSRIGDGTKAGTCNGSIFLLSSEIENPLTIAGSAIASITMGNTFLGTLSIAGSASVNISDSSFITGSSAAIAHGSSNLLTVQSCCIESSNDPAITGSGTGILKLSGVSFTNNSNISGSLTVQSGVIKGGNFISQYVVDATGESGAYKTVQAAINAANSAGGDDIFLQPGIYTENLTLFDNVNIIGTTIEGCEIIGTHTPSVSGDIQFHNLTLSSATDIFNSSAAGTTQIIVTYSITNCTNGYLFNLPNWTGVLDVSQSGSVGTQDGFINNTGGATIVVHSSRIGDGTKVGTASNGTITFFSSEIENPLTIGGTATASITMGNTFLGTLSIAGSASVNISDSSFLTGSNAAINHTSSNALDVQTCTIESSNNPAITGTGTGLLSLSGIDFTNNSNVAGTLTLNTTPRSASAGLSIVEGTNARMGTATLVGGTITVNTTAVTANSRIYLTTQIPSGGIGSPYVSARTPGTSFTITSTIGATDTSTVAWMIVEPA